jgi:hypothetical protein
VRDAQAEANEQRAQRDRDKVDDIASFLVARTRLAGVVTEDGANARHCATDDAAQPQVAEAVQRNGSQASAGVAPLEAPRAGLDSAGVAVALANRMIRQALARTNGLSVGPIGCDLAGDGDRGGVGLVERARLDLDGHLVGHSQRMLAGPMFDAVPDQRDG